MRFSKWPPCWFLCIFSHSWLIYVGCRVEGWRVLKWVIAYAQKKKKKNKKSLEEVVQVNKEDNDFLCLDKSLSLNLEAAACTWQLAQSCWNQYWRLAAKSFTKSLQHLLHAGIAQSWRNPRTLLCCKSYFSCCLFGWNWNVTFVPFKYPSKCQNIEHTNWLFVKEFHSFNVLQLSEFNDDKYWLFLI